MRIYNRCTEQQQANVVAEFCDGKVVGNDPHHVSSFRPSADVTAVVLAKNHAKHKPHESVKQINGTILKYFSFWSSSHCVDYLLRKCDKVLFAVIKLNPFQVDL